MKLGLHWSIHLRILVYLGMHDSGQESLEHLLLSQHPSQRCQEFEGKSVEPTNPESITNRHAGIVGDTSGPRYRTRTGRVKFGLH